ncbi:MAG TPA: SpoIID/LytB domain-containing protein [Paludibacter sp.]
MKKKEPIIQVGILSASEIRFVLNGYFKVSNDRFYTGKKVAVYRKGDILFDGNLSEDLSFEPMSDDCSIDIKDVVIGINFHWQRRENQRFKGSLKFIVEGGKLTAINQIKVEDYLTSVISSEMSATASEELLKAHAVISRSWLLNPIMNKKKDTDQNISLIREADRIIRWYERDAHKRYDVCADDHCQRYQGITRASTETVAKAIEATRGEVLMADKKICDARFSKSCGGISEAFENCWAPEHHSYLIPVVDNNDVPLGFELDLTDETNAEEWIRRSPEAFCNTTDKNVLAQVLNNYDQETTDFYRWKVEYTQEEVAELLARRSNIHFGQIIDLIPEKRGASGRIIELKIVGTERTMTVGKELEIRKWLSNSHLYSSAFVVDKSDIENGIPQHFTLTGAGWGHGVGLCQIGAAVMGEKGYKYDQILLHYFREAELKKIY